MCHSQVRSLQGCLIMHIHDSEIAMSHTTNIAAISGCAQCHASSASVYAPIQTIYTASRRMNFTYASERIGLVVQYIFLTMIAGRNIPALRCALPKGHVKSR